MSMAIVQVILLLFALAFGQIMGIGLPLVLLRKFEGFSLNVFTLPACVLVGVMSGYLLASRFEDLLNPNVGIPLGMFAGCLSPLAFSAASG
jgi:hypothetical protein